METSAVSLSPLSFQTAVEVEALEVEESREPKPVRTVTEYMSPWAKYFVDLGTLALGEMTIFRRVFYFFWYIWFFFFVCGSFLVSMFDYVGQERKEHNAYALAGVAFGLHLLGTLCHACLGRHLRLSVPAVRRPPDQPLTCIPARQLFLWVGVAWFGMLAYVVAANCLLQNSCHWTPTALAEGLIWGQLCPVLTNSISAPYYATMLLLLCDMENLETLMSQATTQRACEELQEAVKQIQARWKVLLRIHFCLDGLSVLCSLASFGIFGFKTGWLPREEQGLDVWIIRGITQWGAVFSVVFLILQVLSLARFNSRILDLQRSTGGGALRELVWTKEKELQFTVFGVSITNSKIKGLVVSAVISMTKSLWSEFFTLLLK